MYTLYTNITGCNENIVSVDCLDKVLKISEPKDVGFGGLCPTPTYESNGNCCCGNDCCWNKCTWDNPPDNCLDGVIKGQWMFDVNKEYFTAVKYWNGSGKNRDCCAKFATGINVITLQFML